MDMKNTMAGNITKGDLVLFKPENNDDPWADRIALVLSLDTSCLDNPYLTLLCRGQVIKAQEWAVEKVQQT